MNAETVSVLAGFKREVYAAIARCSNGDAAHDQVVSECRRAALAVAIPGERPTPARDVEECGGAKWKPRHNPQGLR